MLHGVTQAVTIRRMIKSFSHKGLEKFFTTGNQGGIQVIHAKRLRLILALLNDANQLEDLESPALLLHRLKGDLEGFWSLTVQASGLFFALKRAMYMLSIIWTTTNEVY